MIDYLYLRISATHHFSTFWGSRAGKVLSYPLHLNSHSKGSWSIQWNSQELTLPTQTQNLGWETPTGKSWFESVRLESADPTHFFAYGAQNVSKDLRIEDGTDTDGFASKKNWTLAKLQMAPNRVSISDNNKPSDKYKGYHLKIGWNLLIWHACNS